MIHSVYFKNMFPKTNLAFIFIVVFSWFPSCFSSLQGNSLSKDLDSFTTMVNYKSSTDLKLRRLVQVATSIGSPTTVNVEDFRSNGDGIDDTQVFKSSWEKTCKSSRAVVIVVPKGKSYVLKPITFTGPCKSPVTLKIYGTINASTDQSDYKDRSHWISFHNVNNLRVEGGGIIDGNGKIWWNKSCKIDKTQPCTTAPTAVTFYQCKNLKVDNIEIRNAQQMHITFQKCVNVMASNIIVISPEKSPNTDGIHVTNTQNIKIANCLIKTGDDCISIVSGSKNVVATDITCGPGHGISIGSLGSGNSAAFVSNVLVNRAKLSGSTNGVRIKTWQGGSGYAKNIVFENIIIDNVLNPIIIDQHYCDQKTACQEQASAVQVSNVVYKNIKGTSASDAAVRFDCSKRFPCKGIVFHDINIVPTAAGQKYKASCDNVRLTNRGLVSPKC